MSIHIVNIIPNSLSNEASLDSEPSIAVNPINPQQIVITTFTPLNGSPGSVTTGPYFYSIDGGNTWSQNSVFPDGNASFPFNDASVRFSGSSILYAGIISATSNEILILRKTNISTPSLMDILVRLPLSDQPWVEAMTEFNTDRVYVSYNDLSQNCVPVSPPPTIPYGLTASVDFHLNAASAAPPPPSGFTTAKLEVRDSALIPSSWGTPLGKTCRQDGPPVRLSIHRSGVIYGTFMGWRTIGEKTTGNRNSPNTTDIVVVRDDRWASGPAPFTDLIDPMDGKAGLRVVTSVSVCSLTTKLGTTRIGQQLAIVVDSLNSQRVYIAWCDGLSTTASPYTLHVRRSEDGGQSWTGDLLSRTNVTNPALAVNSRGELALLYQESVTVSGSARWRTHLLRSTNHFVSVATDDILADVLDLDIPNPNGVSTILGDYINIIAIGKDFYDVFCGNNYPDMANFPQRVIYGRNVDWSAHKLLDDTNNPSSNITTSIDPFFFHYQSVPLYDDFYVRDWTDNPTTGDDGSEPSIKQEFYLTSDVWNRRGTLPGSFPNDQPENEDAGNGTGIIGDNWLFTRIRRRASAPSGSPANTVTAHFLVANFGLGTNFVDSSDSGLPSAGGINIDVPDPTLTFSASEVGPKITDALHWTLAPTSSTHLCIAVEISSANDPYYNSSLHGRSPGWPNTDLEIVYDNNKAQRNIKTSTTPARGVGLLGGSAIQYGIIHNAATYTRDMNIQYRLSSTLIKHKTKIEIHVIGQEVVQAKDSGIIVLKNMQPGENRWIELGLRPPKGENSEVLTVFFEELIGASTINGFGIGIRLGSQQETFTYILKRIISVFRRLTVIWKMETLEKHIQLAIKILHESTNDPHNNYLTEYFEYLENNHSFIQEITKMVEDQDPFDIKLEGGNLSKLLNKKSYDDILICLPSYLERIESYLTTIQLAKGDIADILQNVRWQYGILQMLKQKSSIIRDIEEQCLKFIQAWETRKVGIQDYPSLVEKIIPLLSAFASEMDDKHLLTSINYLKGQREIDLLQGLHRQVLLQIQSALKNI